MAPSKKLVIVESPTKAKTIRKFLGNEYRVEASMGHVRDLPATAADIPEAYRKKPWARTAVDIENGFTPIYVVPSDKVKVVAELKKALKEADELFVATDEDREGESIGWHLVEVLKPKVPTHRMVFHEITKDAIQKALNNTREINQQLVSAQEARRVLDRLVGYTVSPLLWKKVKPRLSAGRVQSVAVRMLVERERQRIAFVKGSYWGIKAHLKAEAGDFDAVLQAINGTRTATGRDFDKDTGTLTVGSKAHLVGEAQARALAGALPTAAWTVTSVERKENSRSAYPPFTTSTLQQEANRKLGLSARDTMRIAQKLYEQGLITYMRTDSVNLSDEAIHAARGRIDALYGKNYLSKAPRQFTTKSAGAQEAHEAIRPAGREMRTAEELRLADREYRLYDLIWKRTMATQMADAKIANTTALIEVRTDNGENLEFRAAGREVVFPGFLRAYVEGADDPSSALDDQDSPLPRLRESEHVKPTAVTPEGHETQAPARYTEASLVKALEDEGIGRPSTYATIIDTIQRREYAFTKAKQLVPTFTGMAVTNLLEQTHAKVVDTKFTAAMETRLDTIASSNDAKTFLADVYNNDVLPGVSAGAELDPREICTIKIDRIEPTRVRVGQYGPYLEIPNANPDEKPRTLSLPEDIGPADLTPELVEELTERAERGDEPIAIDPASGEPIYLKSGRYGAYLQLGTSDANEKPKNATIPKEVPLQRLTPELAIALVSLPRTIGEHPETGKPISANFGKFGPYVQHEKTYASLKPKEGDDVFTVGLDRALELFALKAAGGPGRAKAAPVRVLGEHPDGTELGVYDGRYGAYVKYGTVNATIPQGSSVESITLEEAIELVNLKAASAPKKKTAARKTTTKAATTKAATTKAATTKAATTKAAAKTTKTATKTATKAAPKTAKATTATDAKPATTKAAAKTTKTAAKPKTTDADAPAEAKPKAKRATKKQADEPAN